MHLSEPHTWLIGGVVGAALWTLLEYVLHRWVFHRGIAGKWLTREHLEHHARVSWFVPLARKLLLSAVILPVIAAIAALLLGSALGITVAVGVFGSYAAYEWLHRRIHRTAPKGPYGRWVRRHHLQHHFGHPHLNHGVTTPLWDWVFGTLAPRTAVRVPRRHLDKFPWLVEGGAATAPEAARVAAPYAADYQAG